VSKENKHAVALLFVKCRPIFGIEEEKELNWGREGGTFCYDMLTFYDFYTSLLSLSL
jgi:hypothetical protein